MFNYLDDVSDYLSYFGTCCRIYYDKNEQQNKSLTSLIRHLNLCVCVYVCLRVCVCVDECVRRCVSACLCIYVCMHACPTVLVGYRQSKSLTRTSCCRHSCSCSLALNQKYAIITSVLRHYRNKTSPPPATTLLSNLRITR